MINGHINGFYKMNVKPWDIMAGSAILSSSSDWDICFFTPDFQETSLFSNSKSMIDHINKSKNFNNRIGHLIITQISKYSLKKAIIDTIKKNE